MLILLNPISAAATQLSRHSPRRSPRRLRAADRVFVEIDQSKLKTTAAITKLDAVKMFNQNHSYYLNFKYSSSFSQTVGIYSIQLWI